MSLTNISKDEKFKNKKAEDISQSPQKSSNEDLKKRSVNQPNHPNSRSKKFTERLFPDGNDTRGNILLEKWGLTPEQVAEAEKFILEIEEKVDECCPIRGSKKK